MIVPKSKILVADDMINLLFTRGLYGVFPMSTQISFTKAQLAVVRSVGCVKRTAVRRYWCVSRTLMPAHQCHPPSVVSEKSQGRLRKTRFA